MPVSGLRRDLNMGSRVIAFVVKLSEKRNKMNHSVCLQM